MQRHPNSTLEQMMVYVKIPNQELRHSRAAQELIEEGRQEGLQLGEAEGRRAEAASMTLRLLTRRCSPLSEATTARIQALPQERLEALADALLDFSGAEDLTAWLAAESAHARCCGVSLAPASASPPADGQPRLQRHARGATAGGR